MKIDDVVALQNIQMEIMDEIHRVCTNNNLRYYLIGGSALGAVRHKGIIPWDVDIDIAMPRTDYELLIHKFASDFSTRFSIHDYTTDKGFDCPHILVYLNDSTLIGSRAGDLRDGIYVDILPLDSCPIGRKNNLRHGRHLAVIKKIIANRKYRPGRNIVYSGAHFLTSSLLRLFPIDMLNGYQQKVMKKYNTEKNATHWCSKASHYSYEKLCMPIEYFGTPTLMAFSNREYYVPEKVEQYLTQLFGDYMKCPSVEKQNQQMQSVKYACWKDRDGNSVEIGER